MQDPLASFWLKRTLSEAVTRDPVDAYKEAALAADLLKIRVDWLIANSNS